MWVISVLIWDSPWWMQPPILGMNWRLKVDSTMYYESPPSIWSQTLEVFLPYILYPQNPTLSLMWIISTTFQYGISTKSHLIGLGLEDLTISTVKPRVPEAKKSRTHEPKLGVLCAIFSMCKPTTLWILQWQVPLWLIFSKF